MTYPIAYGIFKYFKTLLPVLRQHCGTCAKTCIQREPNLHFDQILSWDVITACSVESTSNKPVTHFQTLRWRHNGRDSVSNHQPHGFLLNRLFRRRSKKASKLRVTGLCVENSPGTGEFPAQMASNAGNVSIWWRHHGVQHRGSAAGVCYKP